MAGLEALQTVFLDLFFLGPDAFILVTTQVTFMAGFILQRHGIAAGFNSFGEGNS